MPLYLFIILYYVITPTIYCTCIIQMSQKFECACAFSMLSIDLLEIWAFLSSTRSNSSVIYIFLHFRVSLLSFFLSKWKLLCHFSFNFTRKMFIAFSIELRGFIWKINRFTFNIANSCPVTVCHLKY